MQGWSDSFKLGSNKSLLFGEIFPFWRPLRCWNVKSERIYRPYAFNHPYSALQLKSSSRSPFRCFTRLLECIQQKHDHNVPQTPQTTITLVLSSDRLIAPIILNRPLCAMITVEDIGSNLLFGVDRYKRARPLLLPCQVDHAFDFWSMIKLITTQSVLYIGRYERCVIRCHNIQSVQEQSTSIHMLTNYWYVNDLWNYWLYWLRFTPSWI